MRWFVGAVLAILIGLGAYVASAVVSLNGLVQAARAGDGTEVLARTDIDRLRRSVVDQVVAAYLKQLGRDRPVKPLERLAANTYGASVADAMIAKLLTKDNLTSILSKGVIRAGSGEADIGRLMEIDTSKIFETLQRISIVKPVEFLVLLGRAESAGGFNMHFEGSGWKLSGVLLPEAAVRELAQELVSSRSAKG
ncbi:DUF2939 domain-containing protein [Bradyrhizobium tropiciagri]|uniref:DUF2939 domain-containing protein n=1 Tax=Bradyrhizobium tropiciagri TaxID=312253 RepID=UPI001BA63B56|nr:DUF2939 domain-containing protein [Bradyrhizobium tropiciagri]MBR0875313.1 DUF2939 domain-containing protein [Bradyrhizobium tropiciagri]